jgi:hypothetical protein
MNANSNLPKPTSISSERPEIAAGHGFVAAWQAPRAAITPGRGAPFRAIARRLCREPQSIRAGAEASPEPGHSRGYTMKTFHKISYANRERSENLSPQARTRGALAGGVLGGTFRPIHNPLVTKANTPPMADCLSAAPPPPIHGFRVVDEAQIIDMQGKSSANHGCPPQVGARVDTEPAPKARAHGRHRRAAPGAHAPGVNPDRRGAAPPGGAHSGSLSGLGLAFGLRADAIGCRIRMAPPPAPAGRSSETRYIGGSP